jgi:AcrR family transcriptional regulator
MLRAIARQLGMTAPALYRYFPSREDLLEHVIADLYDEVTDALEAARDELPAGDVGRPMLAASRRFRRWALDHPEEFGLLFGSPIAGVAGDDPAGPAHDASRRFGRLFGELIARLYQR